jgi:hypothetical protein
MYPYNKYLPLYYLLLVVRWQKPKAQQKKRTLSQSKDLSLHCIALNIVLKLRHKDPELVSTILVVLLVFGHAKTTLFFCRGRRRVGWCGCGVVMPSALGVGFFAFSVTPWSYIISVLFCFYFRFHFHRENDRQYHKRCSVEQSRVWRTW